MNPNVIKEVASVVQSLEDAGHTVDDVVIVGENYRIELENGGEVGKNAIDIGVKDTDPVDE